MYVEMLMFINLWMSGEGKNDQSNIRQRTIGARQKERPTQKGRHEYKKRGGKERFK
jgi:hypothetical protein